MKNHNFKKAFNLFYTCILIGAQMFGSGMAVVPILQREFVEKRKWITDDELVDILSICKCAPGAYTVNIVVFIGNKYCGFLGGMMAALGITIVPIIVIILFTAFYKYISQLEIVKNAMTGITVCVCSLVVNYIITLWKKVIISKTTFIIFLISLALYVFTNINIVVIILVMGLLNLLLEKFIFPKFPKSEGKI